MDPKDRLTLIIILTLLVGATTSCAVSSSTTLASVQPSPTIEQFDVTQLLLTPPEPQLPDVEPDQLLEQALQETLKLLKQKEEWQKLELIKDIASNMAEAGQIEKALRVVSSLDAKQNKIKALSEVALNLSKLKQPTQAAKIFEQALELAKTIVPELPSTYANTNRVSVLVELAETMIEAGQPELALKTLLLAIQITETSQDYGENYYSGDSIGYRAVLAISLAKIGQFEQALHIAHTIQTPVIKVKAWVGIAVELASVGQVERAEKLLSDAMKLAQTLTEGYMSNGSCYVAKSDALREVVAGLAQVDRIQEAFKIAKNIEDCSGASEPNLSYIAYRGDAYANIIQQLKHDAEIKAALLPISALRNGIEKYEALAQLALKLAELGKAAQAIQIADQIVDGGIPKDERSRAYPMVEILSKLSKKLAEQGEFEPAIQISQKFQDVLRDEDKAMLLIEIGKELIQAGRSQQAISLFSEAFHLAQTASPLYGEDVALRYKVAAAFVRSGQVKIAMQLIRTTPPVASEYGTNLAIELAKAKQFKLALPMAQRDPKALTKIAVELSKYQSRDRK